MHSRFQTSHANAQGKGAYIGVWIGGVKGMLAGSLRYHAPHCEECLPPLKIDVKCHTGQTEGNKKIYK